MDKDKIAALEGDYMLLPDCPEHWLYENIEWSIHDKKWTASIISYKYVMVKEKEYRHYGRGQTPRAAALEAIKKIGANNDQ